VSSHPPPQHHRVSSEEQRLRDTSVALDTAIGDERHTIADGHSAASKCFDLRHAEVRGDSRRTTTSRPDTNLDAVHASIDEETSALLGRDVAGNQLHITVSLADLLDGRRHDLRM